MVHMSKPYPRSSRKNQLDFLHQFLLRFGDIMRRAELRDHFAAHVEVRVQATVIVDAS